MTPQEEQEFEYRALRFLEDLREVSGYNFLLSTLEAMLVKRGLMQPIQRDLIKGRKCPGLSPVTFGDRLACERESGHDGKHCRTLDGYRVHTWDGGLEGRNLESR